MPLFLGAKSEDVLSRRGTADFLARLREQLFGRMANLPPGEELALLHGMEGALREEIAYEERVTADFSRELDELDAAQDAEHIAEGLVRLRAMAAEHFRRRGSVQAFHLLCSAAVDRATAAALRIALRWMDENGPGVPPSPWCWMALGQLGRWEATTVSSCDFLLVHGAEASDETAAFAGFAGRATTLLQLLGLASRSGIVPAAPSWRGSMADWRKRITTRVAEVNGDLEGLVRLADMRFVAGNATLAAEMVNLVRSMLAQHPELLWETARRTAMMTSGFDFFGRLRLEKGGEHRGAFNLGFYGIEPLVANVRLLTVRFDVPETGTMERVRALLQGERIDVGLAERLLQAWHTFGRYAVERGLVRGWIGGTFITPGELPEAELDELKRGVEAVGSLQKIVYSSVAVRG